VNFFVNRKNVRKKEKKKRISRKERIDLLIKKHSLTAAYYQTHKLRYTYLCRHSYYHFYIFIIFGLAQLAASEEAEPDGRYFGNTRKWLVRQIPSMCSTSVRETEPVDCFEMLEGSNLCIRYHDRFCLDKIVTFFPFCDKPRGLKRRSRISKRMSRMLEVFATLQ